MSYRDLFGIRMKPDASTPASMPTLNANEPPGRVEDQEIVESDRRVSESLVVRQTEEFYQQSGIAAWKNVPFYPTSNPFVARTYVELLLAFLLDYEPWLKRDEPVYFLELGAGTGAFAFYCLKELQAQMNKNFFSELQGLDLRYVMTDFAEKNVAFWESHEKFRPFTETGLLDFAVHRSDAEDGIVLRRSGRSLRPG
jgi:methylase of polypeptide subunit release factors